MNLLNEWGAYLDGSLYNSALIHFLDGSNNIVFQVAMIFENKVVGKQKMQLLDDRTIFHLSSINKALKGYEKNIKRLIKYADIKTVQWINFNKNNITLKTIEQ